MWTCPKCDERIDHGFDVCWRCGTSFDGDEDPDFLTADQVGPIEIPSRRIWDDDATALTAPDDALAADLDPNGPIALVECYWARDLLEARYLTEELTARGIPAVTDDATLAAGMSAAAIGHPYFSPRVRVRAQDLPRARAWLASYERRPRREPSD